MLSDRKNALIALMMGLTSILHGCGGGSDSNPTVTVFPVDRVITELAVTGGRFNGTRLDATGVSETLSVNYLPASLGQFTRQEILTQGSAASTKTSTIDYLSQPFQVTGWIDQALNPVDISQLIPLPVSTSLGNSSIMMFGTQYIQDNGLSTSDIGLTHRVSLEWSLTAHSATTADLCLNQTIAADFISTKNLDCFEIDETGKIIGFKGIIRTYSRSIDYEVIYE